ncbi:MAG TPA: ATP-binding protein [Terriglobales bacterium]|nr:ATP-binding protein [Terriglobales bacterium]
MFDTGTLGQANYGILGSSLILALSRASKREKGDGNRLSMTAKKVVYKLDSTLESVNEAEQKASELASASGFDEEEALRIEMAVREAAVNAVYHGNGYDPNKKMTLAFERTEDALVITVSDEGHGLDPETLPDPLAPENLLKPSGRGIFLIRSFMDEVRFRKLDPGTEITLIKHVRSHDADGKEESK